MLTDFIIIPGSQVHNRAFEAVAKGCSLIAILALAELHVLDDASIASFIQRATIDKSLIATSSSLDLDVLRDASVFSALITITGAIIDTDGTVIFIII